jgi:hypothetical protein
MVDTWAWRLEGEGSQSGLFVPFPVLRVPGVELMVRGCELRVQGSWLPCGFWVGSSGFVVSFFTSQGSLLRLLPSMFIVESSRRTAPSSGFQVHV